MAGITLPLHKSETWMPFELIPCYHSIIGLQQKHCQKVDATKIGDKIDKIENA